jgi:heme/copper-type cytochrome/quinol oxidase subunit 2
VSLHNSYLAVLSALFALVFAIMIHSLARHRRACRNASFSGPGGSVQYLWAMVPVAILAGIDFALIEAPAELRAQAPAKIELAAASLRCCRWRPQRLRRATPKASLRADRRPFNEPRLRA